MTHQASSTNLRERFEQALQSKPPRPGIGLKEACRKFHRAPKTIKEAIADRKIRAGRGYVLSGGKRRPSILVSPRDLICLDTSRSDLGINQKFSALPKDAAPIAVLVREFHEQGKKVSATTLTNWCEWETQPALDRKVKSGFGPYEVETTCHGRSRGRPSISGGVRRDGPGEKRLLWGIQMSRADALTCVEALYKNPIRLRLPGNPGFWISLVTNSGLCEGQKNTDGIFRHNNGSLWYTRSYVSRNYDIGLKLLSQDCYVSKLERIEVYLPGKGMIDVFSEASVELLCAWRKGKTSDGRWKESNKIWQDSEGLQYSNEWIAENKPCSLSYVSHAREDGLLGDGKLVPRDPAKGGSPRSRRVYKENKVFAFLDGVSPETSAENRSGLRDPVAPGTSTPIPPEAVPPPDPKTKPTGPVENEPPSARQNAKVNVAPKSKGRRGRKKGSFDLSVANRKKEMLEAWDRNEFGNNKAKAASAFGFEQSNGTKIINAHERSKASKQSV
jgi:hypothetical protein